MLVMPKIVLLVAKGSDQLAQPTVAGKGKKS